MEEKEWLTVPGVAGYEISRDMEVRRMTRNGWKMVNTSRGYINVNIKGKKTNRSVPRLLYAATHSISLENCPDISVVKEGGKLTLVTRREFLHKLRMQNIEGDILTKESFLNSLDDAERFLQVQRNALETGEYSSMTAYLYTLKEEVVRHILCNTSVSSPEKAEDYFIESITCLVEATKRRTRVITSPLPWLKAACRRMIQIKKKYRVHVPEKWDFYDFEKYNLNTI